MGRNKRPEGTHAPNGASSIYLGKDGLWHGRVTMGVCDDGTPDRRHVKRKTEGDVIRAVRALEKERDSGKTRKAGRAWTVEKWLRYWVESIAAPSVRHTTLVGYRSSVYNHLIPGIGAHRIDKLRPEHLEALYRRMLEKDYRPTGKSLKPATVHPAHRTVRVALNEAVRRRHFVENPRLSRARAVERSPSADHFTSGTGSTGACRRSCGHRFGMHCPERHGGGRAGRRTVGLPHPGRRNARRPPRAAGRRAREGREPVGGGRMGLRQHVTDEVVTAVAAQVGVRCGPTRRRRRTRKPTSQS